MPSPFIVATQTSPLYVNSPGDCALVLAGSDPKQIAQISWSLGYGGGGVAATNYPAFARILLFDGGVPVGSAINNVTFQFSNVGYTIGPGGQAQSNDGTPGGISAYGGTLRFDQDVVASASGGGIGGTIAFPADPDVGFVTQSGSVVIVLTAARHSDNTYAAGVVGKLSVQYRTVPAAGSAGTGRTYSYAPVSKPLN